VQSATPAGDDDVDADDEVAAAEVAADVDAAVDEDDTEGEAVPEPVPDVTDEQATKDKQPARHNATVRTRLT
jgi:hypothetical protein